MESVVYKSQVLKRVMAILAHPDDEAIACGGLLAKTVRDGGQGFVYVMTSTPERLLELEKSWRI